MQKIKIISSIQNPDEEPPPNLLKAWVSGFCNVYSFFLVFPYRFCWDKDSQKVSLVSSKLHQILCVIVHTIIMIGSSSYLISIWAELQNEWKGPSILFSCSTSLLCFFVFVGFSNIIWRKQDIILEVIDWHTRHQKPVQLYKIGLLCAVPILLPVIYNPVGRRYDLFVMQFYSHFDPSNSLVYSKPHYAVGWLIRICLWSTHIFYLVSNGLMTALIFSIIQYLHEYREQLKDHPYVAGDGLLHVVRLDVGVRTVTDLTTKILSSRLLLDYLICLSYYATIYNIYNSTNPHNIFEKIHSVLYFVFAGSFWFPACEVNFLAPNITREWIQRYKTAYLMKSPETLKQYNNCLLALQNDCDLNPAGISCRCFKISYGFAGSMFGLILTYSIIIYQMTSEIRNKGEGRNCTSV